MTTRCLPQDDTHRDDLNPDGRNLQEPHRGPRAGLGVMDVMFLASVSVITPDPPLSRKLYADALGLPLHPASEGDEYYFADTLDGCKHFGVWPLSQAAEACFGRPEWPADRPVPQVSIEFDVASAE